MHRSNPPVDVHRLNELPPQPRFVYPQVHESCTNGITGTLFRPSPHIPQYAAGDTFGVIHMFIGSRLRGAAADKYTFQNEGRRWIRNTHRHTYNMQSFVYLNYEVFLTARTYQIQGSKTHCQNRNPKGHDVNTYVPRPAPNPSSKTGLRQCQCYQDKIKHAELFSKPVAFVQR